MKCKREFLICDDWFCEYIRYSLRIRKKVNRSMLNEINITAQKNDVYQILGTIQQIQITHKACLSWNIYKHSYVHGTPEFDVNYFHTMIDGIELDGCFTKLSFKENEPVEAVIFMPDDVKKGQLLALKTLNQILYIDPRLHTSAQLIDFKTFLEKSLLAILIFALVVTSLLYGLQGHEFDYRQVILLTLIGSVTLYFFHPAKLKKDRYFKSLNQRMFSMPMFDGLSKRQLEKPKYFYRMQEFVIDLKLLD